MKIHWNKAFLLTSVDEAKDYAEKMGYKYAHLWFNFMFAHGVTIFQKDWKLHMRDHEDYCIRQSRQGIAIPYESAPVKWGFNGQTGRGLYGQ